jgi:perosamine synthetase
MFEQLVAYIRDLYGREGTIGLHEPCFMGNEKHYLSECIDSTFVSSVGSFVDRLEGELASYTGAKYAVATVNGTAALHIALLLADVRQNDEVITQPLTFVASCNAINYCGANPVFLDVERETLSISPEKLRVFLENNTRQTKNGCTNITTGRIIRACVPMHTFGHPAKIDQIADLCQKFGVTLVEDAAESLGSFYKGKHTGTFGKLGALSFNGNKIITSGGGGAVLTNDKALAKQAKHLTTTAKIPHPHKYIHDMVGYNYRMPNLNAALLCAQIEKLEVFLENKRETAHHYQAFCEQMGIEFVSEPANSRSNYWLNALLFRDKHERDGFLEFSHKNGILTRPIWRLMSRLDMYNTCQTGGLKQAQWIEERLLNIPSSVRV